ncbi:MAG: GtrA family protein [Candidatus Margulisbacteria bacterium]|nr:GtrA family protein [Candidatus Margulisiibacteriota bacterium]
MTDAAVQMVFRRSLSYQTYKQLIKHYFVGGTGSIINYLLFNIFMFNDLGIMISNLFTYSVVIAYSFFMQKYFTYKVYHYTFWQPVLFLLNALAYFLLDTTLLVFMIGELHISPLVAKLISILMLAPLSFLAQKYIVFRGKSESVVVEQGDCY